MVVEGAGRECWVGALFEDAGRGNGVDIDVEAEGLGQKENGDDGQPLRVGLTRRIDAFKLFSVGVWLIESNHALVEYAERCLKSWS